ncbi:Elongation factor-like GTPase 1 [Halocaridina rubra]|uniref:Ribosome assembly protein 1 n=1 Tax=Halocaridina rubra TaxID=373956 RepID=A0AAN8X2S2_HALRR
MITGDSISSQAKMVIGQQDLCKNAYALMKNPDCIRNLCIMAHVDHGKTSLADNLVASNGLISQRLAGRIRYMDSQKEEAERGITMKSSCVSLAYSKMEIDYLINLIDSPGHVDFSSEVSTAVRLCDGAIIVVDVIEGVCAQTKVVLQQAWVENIQPVLVLNKIDRLILEMKQTPLECYYHIAQVLETVNAYMAELYNTAVLGKTSEEIDKRQREERERRISERRVSESEASAQDKHIFADWGIENVDDSDLYFTPEQGNVIFASAYDGWGFSTDHFAEQFSTKLGMNRAVLSKTLWGDYYISSKGGEKKIMRGARDKRKNPLFVSLILENLYKVYDTIMEKKANTEVEKLAICLGVKMPLHVLKTTDLRAKLNFICNKWLPLAPAVLDMVVLHLPSASSVSNERAMKLMCSALQRFDSLPQQTQELQKAFVKCSSDEEAPLIVYVSKIYGVQRKHLSEEKNCTGRNVSSHNNTSSITDEEMAKRREAARRMKEAACAKNIDLSNGNERVMSEEEIVEYQKQLQEKLEDRKKTEEKRTRDLEEEVFVAFARVYSGVLKPGQKVYILGPKHDPGKIVNMLEDGDQLSDDILKDNPHIHVGTIGGVYLLLGRELEHLECATAGMVIGITGLDEFIIKSATLSSTPAMPAFTELTQNVTPILRVAVHANVKDLPKLRAGLKLLNQADPCVQVSLQKSGEYVIVTAGEVHLQRCIDDLQERYAGVPVQVSDPIVPFRETIIERPRVDRLNEAIEGENINTKEDDDPLGRIIVDSNLGKLTCRAAPLPESVTKLLDHHKELLHLITKAGAVVTKSNTGDKAETENAADDDKSERPSVWDKSTAVDSPLAAYDTNFVTGFQLASAAGPLCEEPLMGVCFIVEDWSLPAKRTNDSGESFSTYGISGGQVISLSKDTLRKSFEKQCQRLVSAMYSCVISVNSEVIGKMYNVIGKRQGRIVSGDVTEGSSSWNVTAYLPVIESMNFANELRKSTSGEAVPQLLFSHWEILDVDPAWEPQTTEELAHWGEKSDSENIAKKYINSIRKRKGLATDEKIIEYAEKQRTLSKNK